MQKNRYSPFISNLVQDALWFVFVLCLLSLFRAVFITLFAGELLPSTSPKEIWLTLWFGLRISLKTAGACTLPSFVFGTLLATAWPIWNGEKFRFYWACLVLIVLAILFQARIPYYQEFHTAFSPFLFNTFNDDVGAIISTSIEQYHAVWRTLGALLIATLFAWLWHLVIQKLTPMLVRPLQNIRRPWIAVVLFCLLLPLLAVFIRFGGAFTFNGSIYWKNAARLSQHILNEAVLDDIQAVYRASRIYKKLRKSATQVNVQDVRAAAARLTGQAQYTADDLYPLLARTAHGGKKPQHVFVIIAETYMMWPLLDEYKNYPLARGVRRLLARPDAILIDKFLPASNGTMFGLTSILLGIPELNLQAANQPTAQKPYETALSVQMRAQGYKTRFFYGGFASWENVGQFVTNQQIDESFYAADFGSTGNVWGVPDREFLQQVLDKIGPESSFNIVLTSSNHPPYKVNTNRETDLPTVKDFENLLPANQSDRALSAARMWHFAYADKYLAEFVEKMLAKEPNSLFIITGDHADRWTLESSPSDYKRLAVPLIILGPQVKGKHLSAKTAGSHMDIASTLLERILPKGTTYYALGADLLNVEVQPSLGVSAYAWITNEELGRVGTEQTELLPGQTASLTPEKRAEIAQRLNDIRTVTAWRVLKGTSLKN